MVFRGDDIADYGGFLFEPEAFPLEYKGFWKLMCDDWLYINDILCPFYMEEKTKLSDGRISVYGYTRMNCDKDEGVLFLRVLYDDADESIAVEPICFQEVNFMSGDGQFGRVRPLSTIGADSVVSFICSVQSGEDGQLRSETITGELQWKDVTKYEWKYTDEIGEMKTSYAVTDLYGNLYLLELK